MSIVLFNADSYLRKTLNDESPLINESSFVVNWDLEFRVSIAYSEENVAAIDIS
jgi:hypothetical protein